MARTYRNRHAVPHGWVVRDDGLVYNNDCCARKQIWETRWRRGERCACGQYPIREFRSHVYRKERKAERKAHYRSYRSKVKDRMRHEDWENLPRYRRTSGWLTW